MMLLSAAAPIVVKSATGVLTATGIWSLVGTVGLGLIGCVVAYIRIMPRLRELEHTNNAGLRKEFIDEMATLREEVQKLRVEVRDRDDKIDLLRREIGELHSVIDGLRRQNQTAQISGQRVIQDHLESLPQPRSGK